MRYIYAILMIIFLVTGFTLYEISKKEKIPENVAIIINKKIITKDEFEKLYSLQAPHLINKQEFINTLITKELLIQESQKKGIDKEETFRQAIQNYYEQSLIKLLLDRKFSSININVSNGEIDKYKNLIDKKVHLIFYYYKTLDDVKNNNVYESEKIISDFLNLSQDIRCSLISVNKGEITKPIKIGERYVVIKLEDLEPLTLKDKKQIKPDEIKNTIIEFKREQLINDWILELRKNADIKIYINNN